uniref:CEP76 N-terminal domain-containing protein n=1 Tax=Callorhinchus milii TaxID=7868 RepID=A0A4W3JUI8_CALMI
MDIHSKVREVLAESVREELGISIETLSEEDLVNALRRRGIVDDVMKELRFVTVSILSPSIIHVLSALQ